VLVEITNSELDLLLRLTEAEWCRNFIIEVNLFLVEDEYVVTRDHITSWVYKITTSVDHASELVIQLAIHGLQNNSVSCLVKLELSKNIVNSKVW